MQGAILESGFDLKSHKSGSTSSLVTLFLQTGLAIMKPPPHGAEQWDKGVSSQPKVLVEQVELFPPQTPQESTRFVEPIVKSQPTR